MKKTRKPQKTRKSLKIRSNVKAGSWGSDDGYPNISATWT